MTTQALISGAPSAARAAEDPHGIPKPGERPPPTAAAPTRNARRSISGIWVMVASRLRVIRGVDRLADLLIGAAAADIGHGAVDIGVGRFRLVLEEGRHRH